MTNKEMKSQKLKNVVNIPTYSHCDGEWKIDYYDEYEITYHLQNKKTFRVIVNGVMTKRVIMFNHTGFKWKDALLSAISDYKNNTNINLNKKNLSSLSMYWYYKNENHHMRKNLKQYLFPINTEMGRDTLTEYKLI